MKVKFNFLLLISFLAVLSSCTTTTRYYLVRHAEKVCEDCATCALTTPAGTDRAIALRDYMADKGIDTIFTSQCLRTRLTAEPLSTRLHKTASIYQTGQLSAFIGTLKSFHDNRDILVVSHSDQIPVIIDSLVHQTVVIAGNDFDNIFIITKKRGLKTTLRLEAVTYGAVTP